jgi:hypothetical protein
VNGYPHRIDETISHHELGFGFIIQNMDSSTLEFKSSEDEYPINKLNEIITETIPKFTNDLSYILL